jgi:hypothetical protein
MGKTRQCNWSKYSDSTTSEIQVQNIHWECKKNEELYSPIHDKDFVV